MALPPRDQRHQYLRFEGLEYTNADIADFEERFGKIYGRGIYGPERQPDAAAGALEVAEGALDIDEGAQAVPAPVQLPQPPPTAGPARTLPQRVARLEEEVHGIREALGEQREVYESFRLSDTLPAGPNIDMFCLIHCTGPTSL
ncbi:hypothetical protein Tco_1021400, partial [Tanacetum coccineum]